MTAYIRQPTGIVLLHVQEEMIIDRFSYLHTLVRNAGLSEDLQIPMPRVNPDYLCTGSSKDIASHFLLRMASVIVEPRHGESLRRIVATGESLMWRKRVLMASPAEMRVLHAAFHSEVAKETKRLAETFREFDELDNIGALCGRYVRFLTDLSDLLTATKDWHADHAIMYPRRSDNDCNKCDKHVIDVPWQLCKGLVRHRRVPLTAGRVTLTCSTLMLVLEDAFAKNLSLAMDLLIASGINLEHHNLELVELANRMASICNEHSSSLPTTGLPASKVMEESVYFPPCMKREFDRLAKEHNCHHNTRYQMTLFLKSVGMSVDEQLEFWRCEYSKPAPTLGNTCKWDARRYRYSIRHVYGLEGKREPQVAAGCHRFQNVSPNGPGPICPFRLLAPQLAERLSASSLSADVVANVMELAAAGQPTAACNACLAASKHSSEAPTFNVTQPAHYYLKHKDLLEW